MIERKIYPVGCEQLWLLRSGWMVALKHAIEDCKENNMLIQQIKLTANKPLEITVLEDK